MPNNYKPFLLQIRPQYDNIARDVPENILFMLGTVSAGYTMAQLAAIQGVFDTHWSAMWAEVGNNTAHYTGSVITDWTSASGFESNSVGTFTPVVGGAGGVQGAQVAALISWTVPLRWRGGHFRTYLPSIAVGAMANESQLTN